MRRQGSLEKTTIVGKIEGSRKIERQNMRWTESIKEAIGRSLCELSRSAEDRTWWMPPIPHIARGWRQCSATSPTHTHTHLKILNQNQNVILSIEKF